MGGLKSHVKKGWRRAEVAVPRKRPLGRQAHAHACRSGAGRPGAAGLLSYQGGGAGK